MEQTPIHSDVRAMVHEILLVEALKILLAVGARSQQEKKAALQSLQAKMEVIADNLPFDDLHTTMVADTGESVPPKRQHIALVRQIVNRLRAELQV